MAGSVNKCIIVGNLGADPEIRTMSSGDKVASFRIATSDTWKDKNTGERKERTEWHNIVIFNDGLVKVVEQYVKKGAKLYIEGSLQTRRWQDQNGNDRYTTEVVLQKYRGELQMLDSRKDDGGNDYGNYSNQSSQGQRQPSQGNSYNEASGGRALIDDFRTRDLDDEVLF